MDPKININKYSKKSIHFVKNYNEEIHQAYFFKVDVQYPEKFHDLHNDLPFLPEGMKIKKVEKLATNLHDKTEYLVHIRKLKQALNHRSVFKKAWLMMNNAVFEKKIWKM